MGHNDKMVGPNLCYPLIVQKEEEVCGVWCAVTRQPNDVQSRNAQDFKFRTVVSGILEASSMRTATCNVTVRRINPAS